MFDILNEKADAEINLPIADADLPIAEADVETDLLNADVDAEESKKPAAD